MKVIYTERKLSKRRKKNLNKHKQTRSSKEKKPLINTSKTLTVWHQEWTPEFYVGGKTLYTFEIFVAFEKNMYTYI